MEVVNDGWVWVEECRIIILCFGGILWGSILW